MKLTDIAELYAGLNSQEVKKWSQNEVIYSSDDLVHDLYFGYQGDSETTERNKVGAGNLVMHLMTNKAAIVSPVNEGKIISQRVMKVDAQRFDVDNWYLCYLLNESRSIKHQLFKMMEGTNLRRLSISILGELQIQLPPIAEQVKIGNVYRLMLIQERLNEYKKQQTKKAILNILDKQDIN